MVHLKSIISSMQRILFQYKKVMQVGNYIKVEGFCNIYNL